MVVQGPNIQQQLPDLEYDPTRGTTQTLHFDGVYADVLNTYLTYNTPYYTALGVSVKMRSDTKTGTAELDVVFPFGDSEIPVPRYNVFSRQVEKNFLSSNIPIVQTLSAKDKAAIEDYFKKPAGYGDRNPNFDYPADQATFDNAVRTWLLMKDGVKSSLVFQTVLRKTYICSKQFQLPYPVVADGTIVTTGTLIGIEQVPFDVAIQLPISYPLQKAYTYTDTRVVPTSNTVFMNFNYAFQKGTTQINDVAYNRREVVVEYYYGLYDEVQYGYPN